MPALHADDSVGVISTSKDSSNMLACVFGRSLGLLLVPLQTAYQDEGCMLVCEQTEERTRITDALFPAG